MDSQKEKANVQKHYNGDLEQIKRWKNAPAADKLQWLADCREFFGRGWKVVKKN